LSTASRAGSSYFIDFALANCIEELVNPSRIDIIQSAVLKVLTSLRPVSLNKTYGAYTINIAMTIYTPRVISLMSLICLKNKLIAAPLKGIMTSKIEGIMS